MASSRSGCSNHQFGWTSSSCSLHRHVLENVIDQPLKHQSSERFILILGVSFLRFLYKSRFTEEDLDKYGFHLLALSHVYLVPQLKQRCIRDLSQQLTTENVVDVLQLSRLCDTSDLHLKCIKLILSHFKAVEKTEGWKFLQNHDPWLELEIIRFIGEAESRKKRSKKHREESRLYLELNEAMECLEHIFTEDVPEFGHLTLNRRKQSHVVDSPFAMASSL